MVGYHPVHEIDMKLHMEAVLELEMKKEYPNGLTFINTLTTMYQLVELNTNKNSYTVSLSEKNAENKKKGERRIKEKEKFLPLAYGLDFIKFDKTAGTELLLGNHNRFSYVDHQEFDGILGGPGGTTEAQSLNLIVNGLSHFEIGTKKVITPISNRHSMFRPQAQHYPAGVMQTGAMLPQYGESIRKEGFQWLRQEWILEGTSDNKITIELEEGDVSAIVGNFDAAGGDIDKANYLLVKTHGWHITDYFADGITGACQISYNIQ